MEKKVSPIKPLPSFKVKWLTVKQVSHNQWLILDGRIPLEYAPSKDAAMERAYIRIERILNDALSDLNCGCFAHKGAA